MGRRFYLTPEDEVAYGWALAENIIRADFKPDLVLSLYRGGGLVAPSVVEALREIMGWEFDDFPIKARRYTRDNIGGGHVTLWGVSALPNPPRGRNVLLLDDIYDKGETMRATIGAVQRHFSPLEMHVKVGTAIWKRGNDTTGATPEFYGVSTPGDQWLVQSYEKEGEHAAILRTRLRTDGYKVNELPE